MTAPRWKTYPETKTSSTEWLGRIPAHWGTRRIKYVADTPIRNGIGEAGEFDDPSWPRYVRITDIAGPRRLRNDTFKSLPPELAAESPFEIGDILLAAVGATFGRSYFHVQDIGAVCFAGYLVRFSPGATADPGFASYWTESAFYWAQVQSRVVQATIQNFSAAKCRDLTMPLPGRPEQQAIGRFLDRETAKIDALVEKKERLIELLQEKRTALITHAVTKGLDPDVPMKDSGIEWLGQIPAHWERTRLSALARGGYKTFTDGDWIESPFITDEGIRLVQTGNIGTGTYKEQGFRYISEESFDLLGCTEVLPGDVLICRLADPVGRACRAPDLGVRMITSVDVAVLKARAQAVARYLVYFLSSAPYLSWMSAVCRGGTRDRVSRSFLGAVRIPVPRDDEQNAIADFLDRETAKIDALIAKVLEAIERLKEYRAALISAAVTGKIDVRGL